MEKVFSVFTRRCTLLLAFSILLSTLASAQSTLSGLSGSVSDASGALVPGASVSVRRQEDNTTRIVKTGASGEYSINNLEPGTYNLTATFTGFAPQRADNLQLTARQQVRYDFTLTLAGTETVTVDATTAGAINTTDASIASALSPEAVLDLPANYRGNGSTSPVTVIQTLPGVQPDSGSYPLAASSSPAPAIKFSIQGGLPSQSETTVDGISAQNQTTNNLQGDAFPSAETIAEIRVDGVNNNAEYGQPGEITTVTKSGTNKLHGSVFEYLQNSALNATPFGAQKQHVRANDFGASAGGPVVIPHVFNGRNKWFFFGTYEGLRFPQTRSLQALVPTVRMKQGDFSRETTTLKNPFTGGVYPGQKLTAINAAAAQFLQFYPDPNIGPVDESLNDAQAGRGYNYLSQRRSDINSNQFDARIDRTLGQRGSAFARYTWKNIGQTQAADLTLPYSDSIGQYRIFATSFNYAITSHLLNEVRFGFTLQQNGATNPYNGAAFTNSTKLNGLQTPAFFNGLPHIGFDAGTIYPIGERLNSLERSQIYQYVDNVTLQTGRHTLRFGADVRHLKAHTILGIATPSDNYGNLYFSNSAPFTGNQFADFLVGTPQITQVSNVRGDNDGTADAYAGYAQDLWKATPNLTITAGLRYEFHPAFTDPNGNIANFDPSVAKSGRLIYEDGFASRLAPEELANLNACPVAGVNNPYATGGAVNGAPCTPVLSNSEAGLPMGLRRAPHKRFMPRLGFAYRPFGNDKTAFRGGVGYYNITTSGAIFYALTGTLQAAPTTAYNSETANGPAYTLPNLSSAASGQFGTAGFAPYYGGTGFYNAVKIGWQDPYSLQSNLSIDHDFGRGYAGRISYVGLHTWHLVWQPEQNMLPLSRTAIAGNQPRSAFPFPNFYQIGSRNSDAQANYHSLQTELSHRMNNGLTFDAAYTLAKNLADNQGTYGAATGGNPAAFSDEQGGYNATWSGDRHLDYGNVTGTRRHRFIGNAVYDLPFGRGRRFGSHLNRAADLIAGGFQLSSILAVQSGTFLTVSYPNYQIDPSGTGSGPLFFRQQRPDRIANANTGPKTRDRWFNSNAFACPGQSTSATLASCDVGVGSAPIGRFGTESVGDVTGPGFASLSAGLSKYFSFTDRIRLRLEGTFTNVLNHTNLGDPELSISSPDFGRITQARGSDFGGSRTGQVAIRLEF